MKLKNERTLKKIIYCLLLAVMLTACGGETKKSEANREEAPRKEETRRKEGEKRVGDIIMVNDALGVVFAVTTDGQHGKVMSVSETKCTWDKAKIWCAQYGRGWRLPNKEELKTIYYKGNTLNTALSANRHQKLYDTGWYWSSDEYYSDGAWYVSMFGGYTGYTNKYYDYYVRAVSAF